MVSPAYWLALAVLSVTGISVRLLARRPLAGSHTLRLGPAETIAAAAATLALVFHCLAMFFPGAFEDWGLAAPAESVADLGLASQIAYVVPAAALLLALRRLWLPVEAVLAATLIAVGVTMYQSSGLNAHLAAIAAAVLTLVVTGTALLTVPFPRPASV